MTTTTMMEKKLLQNSIEAKSAYQTEEKERNIVAAGVVDEYRWPTS